MRQLVRNSCLSLVVLFYSATSVFAQATSDKLASTFDAKEEKAGLIKVMLEMDEPSLFRQHRLMKTKHRQTAKFNKNQVQKTLHTKQESVVHKIKQQKINASVVRRFSKLYNGIVITTSTQEMEKLKNLPSVKKVHILRDKELHITESISLIGADLAWQQKDNMNNGLNGEGVKVAVIDSGIDYTHEELGGCFGEGCKVAGGYDYYNNDADPMDDHGHGTHVAGIIAANGQYQGVAPNATLYAYKACGNGCPDESVIAAIEASIDPDGNPLTDDGADIVNISLGGFGGIDSPLSVAVNEAAQTGVLFVISAGNNGESGYQSIDSPGNAKLALTVGSTEKDGQLSVFSSLGPILSEEYQKPEIVAPGGKILSLAPDQGVAIHSGTSMAAPHVAGVAALVKQAKPNLDGQAIKSILTGTIDPLDNTFIKAGSGIVNALNAVSAPLVASKSHVMLGRIDRGQNVWEASQSFILTNISSSTIVLSPSFAKNTVSAVKLSHNLAETVEIVPNGQIEVDISAKVDINALPQSSEYIIQDVFSFVSDSSTFNIPVLMLDAIKLRATSEQMPMSTWVYNLDGSVDSLTEFKTDNTLYILPGDYVVSSIFFANGRLAWPIRLLENVEEDLHVELLASDATNKISIASFINHNGSAQPVEQLQGGALFAELAHPASKERQLQFFSLSDNKILNDTPLYVSSLSDDFELSFSLLYGDRETYSDNYHLYAYTSHHEGISTDIDIHIDGSSAAKTTFELDGSSLFNDNFLWKFSSYIEQGDYLDSARRYNNKSGLPGAKFFTPKDGGEFAKDGMKLTVHGNVLDSERLGKYGIELVSDASEEYVLLENIRFTEYGTLINDTLTTTQPLNGQMLISTSQQIILEDELYADATIIGPSLAYYPRLLFNYWTASCEENLVYRNKNLQLGMPRSALAFCEDLKIHQHFSNFFLGNRISSRVTNSVITEDNRQQANVTKIDPVNRSSDSNDSINVTFVVLAEAYAEKMLSAFINYGGRWVAVPVEEVNIIEDWVHTVTYEITLPQLVAPAVTSLKLLVGTPEAPMQEVVLTNSFVLGGSKESLMLLDRDQDTIADGVDLDKDNDGIPDDIEIINGLNHLDASDALLDRDGDGVDNLSEFNNGTDISFIESYQDSDGDGVVDLFDDLPFDPNETIDTDSDGIGNNADADDDNDGVSDLEDAFPLDAAETIDTDGDGIGNNADTDDDNDGVIDTEDAYPLDASRSTDNSSTDGGGSNNGGSNNGNDNHTENSGGSGGGTMGYLLIIAICTIVGFRRNYHRKAF